MSKPIKIWTGSEWVDIAIQAPSTSGLATTSALAAHEADTTNVHGITDTSQLATQTYVNTQVANLVNSAPAALDTLDELAQALGDDANFATTVTTSIAGKVSKSGGDTITVQSGTTVPLTIQNNGTGNSFVVNDVASDTTSFVIDASGNIGIGTTDLTSFSLTVKGDSIGNPGNSRILAYSGSASSPTENADWPTPVLSLRAFGDFYANSMLSFGYSNDPEYKTDSSVWVFRLEDTAGGTPSRTSSSSTTALQLTGPGTLFFDAPRIRLRNNSVLESPVSTNAQTGTAYTLVLTDAGRAIEMNNASANTLTVPTDASVNFPVGTVIDIFQTGAGQTTVGGAGVTINARPGLKLSGQWATATLIKRATNTWLLTGSLSA